MIYKQTLGRLIELSTAFNNRLFPQILPGSGDLISPTTSFFVRSRKVRDACLAGAQEIQKVQALVVACFANTEKDKVISQSCFGGHTFDYLAKSGKSFNCVLGVVV